LDEEWVAATAAAKYRGEDVSEVICAALRRYVRRHPLPKGDEEGSMNLAKFVAGYRNGTCQHLVGGRSVHEQHVDEVGRGHPACGGDAL
jgi:hypothetical protein